MEPGSPLSFLSGPPHPFFTMESLNKLLQPPEKKAGRGGGKEGRKHRSTKQKKADIQMMLAPHLIEVLVYKRSLPPISYWPSPLVYTADKSVRFCLITKHMVLLLTTWQNILTTWIMGKAPGRLFWSMWKSGQWEAIKAESLEVTFPSWQDHWQGRDQKTDQAPAWIDPAWTCKIASSSQLQRGNPSASWWMELQLLFKAFASLVAELI